MPERPAASLPLGAADQCLIIACGALAVELVQIKKMNHWDHLRVRCLPASLHYRPSEIPARLAELLEQNRGQWDRIFVAYADCGTAGKIDEVCARAGVTRLPGVDCYHTFAGDDYFKALDETPGTFFLTDFLARHFDRFVVKSFKLDTRPENIETVFGNYERVLYLSQTRDAVLREKAQRAADFLGLRLEYLHTGLAPLRDPMARHLIAFAR